jgi:PAS domain S-box-containing protein
MLSEDLVPIHVWQIGDSVMGTEEPLSLREDLKQLHQIETTPANLSYTCISSKQGRVNALTSTTSVKQGQLDMPNLGSRKFLATGTIIFMVDFMIMTVFPSDELLMHFTPVDIAFFNALILALLCTPMILYANWKLQAAPSCVVDIGQDIKERSRGQSDFTETRKKNERADELVIANKEKEKRAVALILANKELAFQNAEKDKRADELVVANKEKEKRAVALILANKELAFQNAEKDKRADELVVANKEKEKRADALILANKELAFQNAEKDKRADELVVANKEKETRAGALILANKELAFQNSEKDKRADELVVANKEKEKRADELVLANKEKIKREDELVLANQELAFQAELKNHRSEVESLAKDLALLIDTANAPIFGIDDQGLVNEWNQQAEKITGFTKGEVMGRDLVADFITDDFKVSVGSVLEKALHGEETANYEFPLFTKAGDRVDVLLNSTTRRSASGKTVGVVGVGQDITELKKTQSQVIQSSKLASLGEMATSVAHELNQPLNTIGMVASNIADTVEFNKVTKEYLCSKLLRIDEQVVRASKIINHMQMFGRKADENLINLDPWVALKSVMDLVGEQLRLESIEVTTNCDYECPIIFGNQIQLEQVFVNIISNARDSILENGDKTRRKLTIIGGPDDDKEFKISITDTGTGIPEKLLPRIFEPFITSKPMGKGTGLGLSVSYGIIREMNGTITAENVEAGAQFTITLPLASTS